MNVAKTGRELIDDAKTRITEISPADAVSAAADKDKEVVFLDVREPNEWNMGHVPGAVHIPRGQLEGRVESVIDRDKRVVVYCAGGSRSALAADTLKQMGYDKVESLRGGFTEWAQAGGEVEE